MLASPVPASPALIAWGWAINLQKNDQVFAVLTGPDGQLARSALLNREVFEYEDPENVVSRMLRLDYFGLPADHYERAFADYQEITREELLRVMGGNLHPEKLRILVVGDESKFDVPLEDFGYEVRRIELD